MSDSAIARLGADQVSEEELRRANEFIAENKDSAVSILLQRVLAAHADGVSVDVFRDDTEFTPNHAAKLLKMSRPHLLSFMDNGELPFRWVGAHRRIKTQDLQEFMAAREAGAEILANALHSPPEPLSNSEPLEEDEVEELRDL